MRINNAIIVPKGNMCCVVWQTFWCNCNFFFFIAFHDFVYRSKCCKVVCLYMRRALRHFFLTRLTLRLNLMLFPGYSNTYKQTNAHTQKKKKKEKKRFDKVQWRSKWWVSFLFKCVYFKKKKRKVLPSHLHYSSKGWRVCSSSDKQKWRPREEARVSLELPLRHALEGEK